MQKEVLYEVISLSQLSPIFTYRYLCLSLIVKGLEALSSYSVVSLTLKLKIKIRVTLKSWGSWQDIRVCMDSEFWKKEFKLELSCKTEVWFQYLSEHDLILNSGIVDLEDLLIVDKIESLSWHLIWTL